MTKRTPHDYFLLAQLEASLDLRNLINFKASLPPRTGWSALPDFVLTLYNLIKNEKPINVVELGSGLSTIITGYALEQNNSGKLFTVDESESYLKQTMLEVERHDISNCKGIHASVSAAGWYDTNVLDHLPDKIDFLIVDGPSQYENPIDNVRQFALEHLYGRLRDNAVIIVDDAKREAEKAMVQSWVADYSFQSKEEINTENGCYVLVK